MFSMSMTVSTIFPFNKCPIKYHHLEFEKERMGRKEGEEGSRKKGSVDETKRRKKGVE